MQLYSYCLRNLKYCIDNVFSVIFLSNLDIALFISFSPIISRLSSPSLSISEKSVELYLTPSKGVSFKL